MTKVRFKLGCYGSIIALTKRVVPNWTPFLTPSMGAITLRTWFPSLPDIALHPASTQLRLQNELIRDVLKKKGLACTTHRAWHI